MYGPVFQTGTVVPAAPMYAIAGPPSGIQPSAQSVYRPVPQTRFPWFWIPDVIGSSDYPWLTEYGPMYATVQRDGTVWPAPRFWRFDILPVPPGPRQDTILLTTAKLTIQGTSTGLVITPTIRAVPTATFTLTCKLIVTVIPAPVSVSDTI